MTSAHTSNLSSMQLATFLKYVDHVANVHPFRDLHGIYTATMLCFRMARLSTPTMFIRKLAETCNFFPMFHVCGPSLGHLRAWRRSAPPERRKLYQEMRRVIAFDCNWVTEPCPNGATETFGYCLQERSCSVPSSIYPSVSSLCLLLAKVYLAF